MKKMLAILTSLVLVLMSASYLNADSTKKVTVDLNKTYQTIDGFGAGYTWYLDRLTKNVNSEEAYDWTFVDAGFNILRFIYPKPDLSGPTTLENCKLVYDAAEKRGTDPLVLVTHCGAYVINEDYSEFTVDEANNRAHYVLKRNESGEYMYDVFAEHCVNVVKDFENAGIPVDYFSFSNEVEWQEKEYQPWKGPEEYASFYFGPEETDCHPAYWKQYIAIYDAFEAEFGEDAPEIIGTEAMNGSLEKIKPYLDPLIEARPDILKTIGFHLYGTNNVPETYAALQEEYPDYKKWQTEYSSAEYFDNAGIIIDELVHENLNAYIYWGGIWAFDEGECLIEAASSGVNTELTRNGSFYMMRHFSENIKRGYLRVGTEGDYSSKLAAFRSPDGSKLVIVVLNQNTEAENLYFDLGDATVLGSQVYRSTEGDNRFANKYYEDLGEYDPSDSLPQRSLTTIVFDLEPDAHYQENQDSETENVFSPIIMILVIASVVIVFIIAIIVFINRRKNVR